MESNIKNKSIINMSFKDSIQKSKEDIDSVKEFINLIEKKSDLLKSVGISVSFKGKSIF